MDSTTKKDHIIYKIFENPFSMNKPKEKNIETLARRLASNIREVQGTVRYFVPKTEISIEDVQELLKRMTGYGYIVSCEMEKGDYCLSFLPRYAREKVL